MIERFSLSICKQLCLNVCPCLGSSFQRKAIAFPRLRPCPKKIRTEVQDEGRAANLYFGKGQVGLRVMTLQYVFSLSQNEAAAEYVALHAWVLRAWDPKGRTLEILGL